MMRPEILLTRRITKKDQKKLKPDPVTFAVWEVVGFIVFNSVMAPRVDIEAYTISETPRISYSELETRRYPLLNRARDRSVASSVEGPIRFKFD